MNSFLFVAFEAQLFANDLLLQVEIYKSMIWEIPMYTSDLSDSVKNDN